MLKENEKEWQAYNLDQVYLIGFEITFLRFFYFLHGSDISATKGITAEKMIEVLSYNNMNILIVSKGSSRYEKKGQDAKVEK